MIYVPYRKIITFFNPKFLPTFKNVFHPQASNTRMIQHSQKQLFKIQFHFALETMKNVFCKWCIGKTHASDKLKSSLYGRDLRGEEFKKTKSILENMQKILIHLAQIEVLAPMNLSTQFLHQRHPKMRHYLKLEILDFCIASLARLGTLARLSD